MQSHSRVVTVPSNCYLAKHIVRTEHGGKMNSLTGLVEKCIEFLSWISQACSLPIFKLRRFIKIVCFCITMSWQHALVGQCTLYLHRLMWGNNVSSKQGGLLMFRQNSRYFANQFTQLVKKLGTQYQMPKESYLSTRDMLINCLLVEDTMSFYPKSFGQMSWLKVNSSHPLNWQRHYWFWGSNQ